MTDFKDIGKIEWHSYSFELYYTPWSQEIHRKIT